MERGRLIDLLESDTVSDSTPLGNVVFPVFQTHGLLALSLVDLLVVRVLLSFSLLASLVLSLSLESILHFHLRQVFDTHGRQVVTLSEHLFFVLGTFVDPTVYCFFIHNNSLQSAVVSVILAFFEILN